MGGNRVKGKWTRVLILLVIGSILVSACGKALPGEKEYDAGTQGDVLQLELTSRGKYVQDLYQAVSKYNLKNRDAKIKVNVTIASEDGDWTRTTADVMSGKGPDLLFLSSTEAELLYEKGAILPAEDCLMRETKDALLKGALDYGTIDGKLVGVMPFFNNVYACIAKKDLVSREEFTPERVMELKRTQSRAKRAFTYQVSPMSVFNEYWYLVGRDVANTKYVDWEKGTSAFEENGFQEVLEFLKEENEIPIGGEALWESGEILFMEMGLKGVGIFLHYVSRLEKGEAQFVGVPSESGGEIVFYPNGMLVINQASNHKKEITDFLEWLLSAETQASMVNTISVRRDVAEYALQRRTKYALDGMENGEQWMWYEGNNTWIGVDFEGTKEEFLEYYAQLMDQLVPLGERGNEISDIVWQEIQVYLEGGKNAQDTVETIDRRVQLYFDER